MKRSDVHPAAWALCIGMLFAVLGCFALAWTGRPIPEFLAYVTTGLVTAVGTILAKTRRDPDEVEIANEPVEVVQSSDDR